MDIRHRSKSSLIASILAYVVSVEFNVALMENNVSYALEISRLNRAMIKNQSNPWKTASGASGMGHPISKSDRINEFDQRSPTLRAKTTQDRGED
tara:strand:+ start:467 stop:751 length:285 start_codon:yes stop_codon:yes gene_type:complete